MIIASGDTNTSHCGSDQLIWSPSSLITQVCFRMSSVFLSLDAFLKRYISSIKLETGSLPTINDDALGASACTRISEQRPQPQSPCWKPVERKQFDLFKELESALEITFPQALCEFYGGFWSDMIPVEHRSGLQFDLIQIWNEEDEARLKQNLLGHVFAKRKNRLPLNYFIGCTAGNDVICLDHESLHIVVEKPGYKSHQKLAEGLDDFILQLDPVVP